MKREHKCPKCGNLHKTVLPLSSEWLQNPELLPLVKAWQSAYLKMGGQFCGGCQSDLHRKRTEMFRSKMEPQNIHNLSSSLIWASQFPELGLKVTQNPRIQETQAPKPDTSGPTQLVLPPELQAFFISVPGYLARIADRLEKFNDFSNIWADDDDEDLGDELDDAWCPFCGAEEPVYESLCAPEDRPEFWCRSCDRVFTLDDVKEAESKKPTTEVKPYQKVLEEEEEHEKETRLVDTTDYHVEDLDGNRVNPEKAEEDECCKGGVCKC